MGVQRYYIFRNTFKILFFKKIFVILPLISFLNKMQLEFEHTQSAL